MSTDREVTQAVRTWLLEGATRLPDRVLDAVLDEVPGIPQRGRIWQVWRPGVRRRALGALALAAVVLIAVVAASRLAPPPPARLGGPGPASASPSIRSVDAGSTGASAEPRSVPSVGPMAGRYIVRNVDGSGIAIAFTVPEGWSSCCDGYVLKANGTTQFSPWVIRRVYTDPCHREGTGINVIGSFDETVRALMSAPGRVPIGQDDPAKLPSTSVDGYSGVRLELVVPASTIIRECTDDQYIAWVGAASANATRYSQNPGQVDELRILDVEGTTFVIQTTWDQTTSDTDRAEVEAIVATIDIVPPPLPAPSASFVPTEPPQPASQP